MRRDAKRLEKSLARLNRDRTPGFVERRISSFVDEGEIREKTKDELERARNMSKSEILAKQAAVDENFFGYFIKVLGRINRDFARRLVAIYYSLQDPDTPWPAKGAIVFILLYFINPLDLIPDLILILGFTDDVAVLATAWYIIESHVKDEHFRAADIRLGSL